MIMHAAIKVALIILGLLAGMIVIVFAKIIISGIC